MKKKPKTLPRTNREPQDCFDSAHAMLTKIKRKYLIFKNQYFESICEKQMPFFFFFPASFCRFS